MFLDRGKRFADAGPESPGNLAESIQHVFFSCGLHLLLVKDVSSAARLGTKSDDILTPQAGDRASQDRRAAKALADVLRKLGRQSRVRRLPHQTQRLPDTLSDTRLRNGDCASATAMSSPRSCVACASSRRRIVCCQAANLRAGRSVQGYCLIER